MNWVQDILSRQIFNYGTEKIWIAALTTGDIDSEVCKKYADAALSAF